MKTKEEIIKILRTILPGKHLYMYEAAANLILSNHNDCESVNPVVPTGSDVSKDTSLRTGHVSTAVLYDESCYDRNIGEYAKAIDDICYEIFNKYISIGNVWYILDANRQISVDKLNNALNTNIEPLKEDQEKILRDAVDALSPLVDEYCPWCSWMLILRKYIKVLDGRKENV